MLKLIKQFISMVFLILFFGVNGFCENIVVEGSTTLLPILQRAAEDYLDAYSDANVSIRGGGSGVGINALISGTCDIASSSRLIKDSESKLAAAKNVNPNPYIVARDGIVVIIHTKNVKKNFTKQEIKDIYTGKTTNWSQLGGKDSKIVVISRDSASGTFECFSELALDKELVRKDALLQASNQAITNIVSKNEGAIGYIGIGYVNKFVKTVTIDNIAPTKQNILESKYPYSRPLLLYTNNAAKGEVQKFIDFLLSKDGQKIVEDEGFISVK